MFRVLVSLESQSVGGGEVIIGGMQNVQNVFESKLSQNKNITEYYSSTKQEYRSSYCYYYYAYFNDSPGKHP